MSEQKAKRPNLKAQIKNFTRCVWRPRGHTSRSLASDLEVTQARCAILLRELHVDGFLKRTRDPADWPHHRTWRYTFDHNKERKTLVEIFGAE